MSARENPSILQRVGDVGVYVLVRVAICIIQSLPRDWCERRARKWSDILANRIKIRRQVVRENLRQAFPEKTEKECREIACGMWEHLLLMIVEIAHAERVIRTTTWRRHLKIHNMPQFIRTLWLDRPKIIVSGHCGNFELAAFLFGLFGFRVYSVARELDNPLLDDFITRFRESRGQRMLPKKGSAPDVSAVLVDNGIIGLLGDQYAGQKGCWVDFFSRPASVHKAIGIFSLTSNAPLLVCSATRRNRLFEFDLRLEGVADPQQQHPATVNAQALSQWFTTLLEQAIRRAPQQYWWVHHRWRGEPPKARVKPPAHMISQ